ncbi:MAG: hypothetical protein QOH80_1136 [Actinomycetota bacterium]|jgi:hypothetical protein|nr:hypothetical protein [Actinomycetota bacterium]
MWHLGFDRLQYPGDDVMQSLFDSTPLAFVAAYLAPAPSQGYTGWMTALPTVRGMGWGVAPVYVGQQAGGGPGSHTLTSAQGGTDAAGAAALAQSAGLDPNSVVYLDIELGGTLGQEFIDYITAWVNGMGSTDYRPGVYCSFSQTAAQVTGAVGDIPIWAFHPIDAGPSTRDLANEVAPDPGKSGFGGAFAWQYRMSLNGAITLKWNDINTGAARTLQTVDLDSCVSLDPSNPTFPTPSISSIDPVGGPAGQAVTIAGSDFDGAVDVAFGGASAANVSFDSDSQISAEVPNVGSGDVEVVISNRWGLQSAPGFLFTVT